MKILLIDNYDSFTYNLYQLAGELLENRGKPFVLDVVRNDAITAKTIRDKGYDRIIISPGPGDPADESYFGICRQVLLQIGQTTPVLGICLGMQGLAHCYGGKVTKAPIPMHGKTSQICHNSSGVFAGLPDNLEVMRYHSLIVDKRSLPASLAITAETTDNNKEIMGLKHKKYPIEGVQFHPESFATEYGARLLENFLSNPLTQK